MGGALRATPRQERSERTIAGLVDATQRVLDRVGREAATTTAIAAEAGVSVGRLYYWFPDLDSLVATAATRASGSFDARLAAVRAAAREQSFGHSIEQLVGVVADGVWSHPGAAELLLSGRETATSPDGGSMRRSLEDCLDHLLSVYVPGSTAAERAVVATMASAIVVAGTATMLTAAPESSERLERELVYALVAYLSTRYPTAGDVCSFREDRPVRPSRASIRRAWPPGAFAPDAPLER